MTATLDRLIGLDRYLTAASPVPTLPHEPAEWLTFRGSDGAPALLTVNGRDMLLCYTSAAWTDAELRDLIDAAQLSGWPAITGVRGCRADAVRQARSQGAMILLDAPLRSIRHVVGFSGLAVDGVPADLGEPTP